MSHDHHMHMNHTGNMSISDLVDHSGHHNTTDHAGHMDPHAGHNKDPHAGHDMSSSGSHAGHGSDGGGHGSMYFRGGYEATILFCFWKIDSIAGLIGSCIGLFIVAALYEGLKVYREKWLLAAQTCRCKCGRSPPSTMEGSINTGHVTTPTGEHDVMIANGHVCDHKTLSTRKSPFSIPHIIQTGLHMLQLTIAYLLMLVFMTYNVWLCLAVILGAGFGYFLFGIKRTVITDLGADCH